MTPGVVRMLGWLVIAHGLSHAVLAIHGGLAATLWVDAIPAGLYVIGMVGFVSAGLGLLGLHPFVAAVGPLLVLAAGLSLVAVARFGEAALWFGGFCDAALLVIGVWRGYSGWGNFSHAAEKSPASDPHFLENPVNRNIFGLR